MSNIFKFHISGVSMVILGTKPSLVQHLFWLTRGHEHACYQGRGMLVLPLGFIPTEQMWAFEGPVFDLWNKFPWVLETEKEEKLEKCGHVIWSLSLCGCLCLGASFLPIGPLIKSPSPLIIPNLVFSVLMRFTYYSLSFIEVHIK